MSDKQLEAVVREMDKATQDKRVRRAREEARDEIDLIFNDRLSAVRRAQQRQRETWH